MKLEENMYVRTKYGISQYKYYDTTNGKLLCIPVKDGSEGIFANVEDIVKASFDVIDLIETRDILLLFDKDYEEKYKAEVVIDEENFKNVINYEQDTLLNLEYELITNEHIELLGILTKEQFEQMAYKVGE